MIRVRAVTDTSGIAAVVTAAKARSITLAGARAAGKLLKTAARATAPKRPGSGALKQAQGVKAAKGTKAGTTASYAVQGARKKVVKMVKVRGRKKPLKAVPAFYDHLVQLGTKPHALGAGESLGRAASRRRKAAPRTAQTSGKHPGARPNPYRERAWAAVKGPAGSAAVAAMGAAANKEMARQHSRVMAKLSGGK